MSRHTINLSDNHWRFGQVSRRPFASANVYDLPAVSEWLPATVPGNVRTALLALGRIPDPFWAEDYKESLWVEDVDWWYRRKVDVEALTTSQRAFLVFEGIDYLSAIFVNGQEMARHEGMFSRQVIEITEALSDGPVELAVRLWGSSALPRRQLSWPQRVWQKIVKPLYGSSWNEIYPDRSATLKCQMSFGWDFAPPIRTMGIWDDVSLVVSGPVSIVEASARGQPFNPRSLPPKATHAPANITIILTLDASESGQVEAIVQVSPANFEGLTFVPFHFPLILPAGRSTQQIEIELPWAALWQPWDRGQPNLYQIQVALTKPDGETLDEMLIHTGIRSIELNQWQFNVNGQREFIRGLNWVPADSFPGRLRREQYSQFLTLARESGANLLRVWGGGLREKQAFYDLCDELGLLVWQEFPFACMFLGTFPRQPTYLAQVEAECSAIVRQLRRHPSVVVWCGGNEFSSRRNRPLLKTLTAVVNQHDPSRPFIPVSPSFDHGGDAHNWDVWHGDAPIQSYRTESARFLSEFGLQALPHLDTLKAALPDPTTGWETHHADPRKLARYTSLFSKEKQAPPTLPLSSHISISQRAQAVALQTAIEHMRRRKGEAGGVCLWQFNEPWPAISWAIVDYFRRPKLAYQYLSNGYNPILVSLKFPVGRCWQPGETFRAEIWAINDGLLGFKNCELCVKLDETLIHSQSLDLPADSIQSVGTLAHALTAIPRQVTLTLRRENEILGQNSYDLEWCDESSGSFDRRLRQSMADWLLR